MRQGCGQRILQEVCLGYKCRYKTGGIKYIREYIWTKKNKIKRKGLKGYKIDVWVAEVSQ